MKKRNIIFTAAMSLVLLVGCAKEGGSSPAAKKCTLSFHQGWNEATYQVDSMEFVVGKTTYMEVKTFQDSIRKKPRTGYDPVWEDFDISSIVDDYTVNMRYPLHEYVITFEFQGRVIGTATYTIESTKEDIELPPLPTTSGYIYHYEDFELNVEDPDDFFVQAYREEAQYYATFVDINGEQVGEKVPFTISTTEIEEPEVPEIDGKDGVWERYVLEAEDIIVHPVYTTHYYYANFYYENGELMTTVPFTKDDTFINEPAVPASSDYKDGYWNYTFTHEDLDIYPVYTDYHVFHAYFKEKAGATDNLRVISYTYQTRNQILPDDIEAYYHFYWKRDGVEYTGGEEIELPMSNITFFLSRKEGYSYTINLDPNGGEVPGGDTVTVRYGESYNIESATIDNPTKAFLAWYTDSDEKFEASGIWNMTHDLDLTAKYISFLSFEEGGVPEFITPKVNIDSIEVTDEDATVGTHSLKIKTASSSNYGVYFAKSFLDEVFADPEVVAINFDARGSKKTNNFRAVIGGTGVTYESNTTNYGLDTEWKKFTFRRSYYEAYQEGDAMIFGAELSETDYVLIDNVIPVFEELTSFGFENGCLTTDNEKTFLYKSAGHGNNEPAPEQILKLYNDKCKVLDFGYTYTNKTEGNRAITFRRAAPDEGSPGWLQIYLSTAIKQSLGTNGYILVDFYSSTRIASNPSNRGIIDGTGHEFGGAGYIINSGWSTLRIENSGVTNDGRFVQICGSNYWTFAFDNIRIVTSA